MEQLMKQNPNVLHSKHPARSPRALCNITSLGCRYIWPRDCLSDHLLSHQSFQLLFPSETPLALWGNSSFIPPGALQPPDFFRERTKRCHCIKDSHKIWKKKDEDRLPPSFHIAVSAGPWRRRQPAPLWESGWWSCCSNGCERQRVCCCWPLRRAM